MTTKSKLEQEIIAIHLDCANRIVDAVRRAILGEAVLAPPKMVRVREKQTSTEKAADRIRELLRAGNWVRASSIRTMLKVSDKVLRNARETVGLERRRRGLVTEYRLKTKKR
jgi:hypothetical protein